MFNGKSVEERAELLLSEWMYFTGYTQKDIDELDHELLRALYNEVCEMGHEFANTNSEAEDNPFDEYHIVLHRELTKRGMDA